MKAQQALHLSSGSLNFSNMQIDDIDSKENQDFELKKASLIIQLYVFT